MGGSKMAKKAYLITYSITTRVVVDDEGIPSGKTEKGKLSEDDIMWQAHTEALAKIEQDPDGYIVLDNVTEFEEDTEMPYGQDEFDR
jgi:hypothetical protein